MHTTVIPSGGLGVGYFNFGHTSCHVHRIRVKFEEISTFCSLMQRAEIMHKDQYKAYVIQALHVEMSKSELHSTVDARRRIIQLVGLHYKMNPSFTRKIFKISCPSVFTILVINY